MYPSNKNTDISPNKSLQLSDTELQAIEYWISEMAKYQQLTTAKQKMKTAREILKFKYNLIGYGLNRIVFDLNNGYILKIAISKVGLLSNENEAYLYNNCNPSVQKYLCPVKEQGPGWIIMKKLNPNIPLAIFHYRRLLQLQFKFLRHGIAPIDLRLANVAFSEENNMLVIDYGLFILDLKSPVLRWFIE